MVMSLAFPVSWKRHGKDTTMLLSWRIMVVICWCRCSCIPSEELTITEDDYGDDYWMVGPNDREEYINRMKEDIQDAAEFEDIENIVSNAKEVLDEMEDLEDNENLVLYGLKFCEKVRVHTMRKTVDNRTYAFGLKPIND